MIITSPIKLQINKNYSEKDLDNLPFEYLDKIYYHYTFHVMKETNEKEFIEYCNQFYEENSIISRDFFYEISMD